LAVPVTVNVVPVPEVTRAVTVSIGVPAVVGVKVIVPVVQELPEVKVLLVVQVPAGIVKKPLPFSSGLVAAESTTGPPVAVRVSVPQLAVEPTFTGGHVSAPEAESVP
jgi:hypothetical protein